MSKSLESLEILYEIACIEAGKKQQYITYAIEIEHNDNVKEKYNLIKQDLELLEQLKQQRDSLAINNGELCVKVCNLEKAFDKACERLDYDCPVGINLIDDLDCENCCDDTKECWKKYFLNLADVEVLE